MDIREFAKELEKRTLKFAVQIVRLSTTLPNTPAARAIRTQIKSTIILYFRHFRHFRHLFFYFAINVRSHMGRKMARAKKPTTAARPTVSIGPMASDIFFMEYSTSVS